MIGIDILKANLSVLCVGRFVGTDFIPITLDDHCHYNRRIVGLLCCLYFSGRVAQFTDANSTPYRN